MSISRFLPKDPSGSSFTLPSRPQLPVSHATIARSSSLIDHHNPKSFPGESIDFASRCCHATFERVEDSFSLSLSLFLSLSLSLARSVLRSIEIRDRDVTCVRVRAYSCACTRGRVWVGACACACARARARVCALSEGHVRQATLWRMAFEKVNRRRKIICYSRFSVGGPAALPQFPPSCLRAPVIIWFCTATLLCVQ